VSADAEWPLFDDGRQRGKISVITLASDVMEYVIVIHLTIIQSVHRVGICLRRLFSRDDTAFVGRMIRNDFTKLRQDDSSFEIPIVVKYIVDVGNTAVHCGVTKRVIGGMTLQKLTATTYEWFLPKPNQIWVGEVFDGMTEFDQARLMYCARDGEVALWSYHKYRPMPNLTLRCRQEDIAPGLLVMSCPKKEHAHMLCRWLM
jgi:hypothetical protein